MRFKEDWDLDPRVQIPTKAYAGMNYIDVLVLNITSISSHSFEQELGRRLLMVSSLTLR